MKDKVRRISRATAARLSEYLLILEQHLKNGRDTMSSKELADVYGNTASQVRQDLFQIENTGRIRHGYNVRTLTAAIREKLGIEKTTNLVIIGCGKLGSAIAEHVPFSSYGMNLKGIFDNDPSIVGTEVSGLAVEDIKALEKAIRERKISMAALCVPPTAAQEVADKLFAGDGIKGILNYTQLRLKVPAGIVVKDSQIVCSFMQLAFFSNQENKK
jgi:redox-sensing transcriptional repressor